jgi:nitroreductase
MENFRKLIRARRSCRAYSDQPLTQQEIEALIADAVWAPSGSNQQPWRFVVIRDSATLKRYSDLCKKTLLAELESSPYLEQYGGMLRKAEFNIFYNAQALVIVYGDTSSHWRAYDCTMVAYNLMLLAEEDGLGSCWIGFAHRIFDMEEIKRELKVPPEYSLVAPIIVGHPAHTKPSPGVLRKPYVTEFIAAKS